MNTALDAGLGCAGRYAAAAASAILLGCLALGGAAARASVGAGAAPAGAAVAFDGTVLQLSLGESRVLRLPEPARRVAVGQPGTADFILLGPQELYVLGKAPGMTNLVMWTAGGKASSVRVQVALNPEPLRELLRQVLPAEREIEVLVSGDAVILKGVVSDALAADTAQRLAASQMQPDSASGAEARAQPGPPEPRAATDSAPAASPAAATRPPRPGVRLVNLLRVRSPQQVMLEVRVAEVSRSYLESLGVEWNLAGGINTGSFMTGFVANTTLSLLLGRGLATQVGPDGATQSVQRTTEIKLEAQRKDAWVKILAEPTIVAMSGQEGSFLVGGKIFIPVNQALGSTTYEERTYGVGLRFVPTVLESGRINLKVAPEVSEPVKESVTAGTPASLPAFKTSFVSTTVQMAEGEHLVIGGLLRDNINQIVKAVPVLGELPVLGAMFRSTQYITERTELLVIVRPTLVTARREAPALPTDSYSPPTRPGLFIEGRMQGASPP